MIIDVKYNLGDNIKYIERKEYEDYGSCPCCNQTGEIIGVDGEKYDSRFTCSHRIFMRF